MGHPGFTHDTKLCLRMWFDLQRPTAPGLASLTDDMRVLCREAASRQDVAERIVDFLYESLRKIESEDRACVLVRCFQTSYYARLPMEYQHAADALLEHMPSHPNMRCLSLLATRGVKPLWNDPATSKYHQCIPLPSVETVKQAPMIARLLEEFGVSAEQLVAFDNSETMSPEIVSEDRKLNIFHVQEAQGSPFVPAQAEFVEPFGVRSVLATGGLLADGDVFAVILFTRVTVGADAAALWGNLASSIREMMMAFEARNSFVGSAE
jgi:hypothetical protein